MRLIYVISFLYETYKVPIPSPLMSSKLHVTRRLLKWLRCCQYKMDTYFSQASVPKISNFLKKWKIQLGQRPSISSCKYCLFSVLILWSSNAQHLPHSFSTNVLRACSLAVFPLGIWQMFFGDCIIAFGNNRKSALVRFCEYMKELKFIYCLRRKNQ